MARGQVHEIEKAGDKSCAAKAPPLQSRTMVVEQVLHMNGGDGESSYAKNCAIQSLIIQREKETIEDAILDYYCGSLTDVLCVADLGCSSGENTISVISDITDTVTERCLSLKRRPPAFQFFLNDLPGNDFNSLFQRLPHWMTGGRDKERGQCFVAGVPGSFYGRLFLDRSIHFFHSSSSIHWLSQVPPELEKGEGGTVNRGRVYISKGSPQSVLNAYHGQFHIDFSAFLRNRGEEMVVGGRMMLVFMSRRASDPSTEENCFQWDLLGDVLMEMASEGLIEEEMVDAFNVPYYCPCIDEVEEEILKEGSFSLKHAENFYVEIPGIQCGVDGNAQGESSMDTKGRTFAKIARAVIETMITTLIGENYIEELFWRYEKALDNYFREKKAMFINMIVYLEKNVP